MNLPFAQCGLALLGFLHLLSALAACASLPRGESGPAADALAREVEAWVNRSAWEQTGAVRFTFLGGRTHLWDRTRGMLQVRDGELEVLLDLWDRSGTATKGGKRLDGEALREVLDDAWRWFCNDTFWLNPLAKLFDDGVRRELVRLEKEPGRRALLVSYDSGGVTPGDSYLWLVDQDGRPRAVRMWVSVLPLKGVEFGWDGWVTLPTGAKVAAAHEAPGGLTIALRDIDGAASLEELLGASQLGSSLPGGSSHGSAPPGRAPAPRAPLASGAADPFSALAERRAQR